ncbi:MAG TPA: signal peptidase I [Candidatus Tyrphobacter sp.]
MQAYALWRRANTELGIALWLWYESVADCAYAMVERQRMDVRLTFGLATLAAAELLQALPAIGGGSSRILLGAVFFLAYAGWTSVPSVHRLYADIVAMNVVPGGDAYQVVDVHSDSMAPTIATGNLAVVDFSVYSRRLPSLGEIVAVALRPGHVYLKRLVALPGDAFEVAGDGVRTNGERPRGWHNRFYPNYQLEVGDGTIEVNGVPLDRSIANVPLPQAWPSASRLPDDCYFVLGDNINDSEDSHVFGCVPRREIVGRVLRVL